MEGKKKYSVYQLMMLEIDIWVEVEMRNKQTYKLKENKINLIQETVLEGETKNNE